MCFSHKLEETHMARDDSNAKNASIFFLLPFVRKKEKHLHIELLTHFYPLGKHKKTGSDKLELKVKPESTESLRDLFGLINPDTDLLLNISPCLKLKSD